MHGVAAAHLHELCVSGGQWPSSFLAAVCINWWLYQCITYSPAKSIHTDINRTAKFCIVQTDCVEQSAWRDSIAFGRRPKTNLFKHSNSDGERHNTAPSWRFWAVYKCGDLLTYLLVATRHLQAVCSSIPAVTWRIHMSDIWRTAAEAG